MINVHNLDFKKLIRKRKVNGERTIKLDIFPTNKNKRYFDLVVEEAILILDDDEYVIKKLNEKSVGNTYWKQVTAVHKFYVDLINKQQPTIHNGSITFRNYMNLVFEDTPYANFEVIDQFNARSFENLGNDNRLALLQKGLDRFKAEMAILPTSYKPIFKIHVGEETDFQFRYGYNIKSISREIDTTDLTTVIRGEWEDGMKLEYRSPNAAIFGDIEAPLFTNENYTSRETRLQAMKDRLQDEPLVSIVIDFVDLRATGYPYAVPNEGDRVFLIYEPLDDLLIETRIMEIEEEFDINMNPVKTNVTLSNYTKSFAGTMFENIQKQVSESEESQNKKIQRAMESADGKNTNYYGANEPNVDAKKGDLWFKVVDGVYTRTYRYDGDDWVLINDMDTKDIGDLAGDAKNRADDAFNRANDAQDSADAIVSRLGGVDGDTFTQISQLDDAINARVVKGDTIAQINLEAETGSVYIGGKAIVLDGDTTVRGSFKVGDANIVNLDAGKLTTGTIDSVDIVGVNITGANITSYNNTTNDVVTLENGEITTFKNGKQRFGIYGNGLVAYHWETEKEVATFRASHINNRVFGAGIMGSGDYFRIGKDLGGGESRVQLHFGWDGEYDVVFLYGGSGERDSRLDLTASRATDGPRLRLSSRNDGNTHWGNVTMRVGLDSKKPTDSNFRSGFEIWQLLGDGNEGSERLLVIDRNTDGVKYMDAWVDSLWVEGNIRSSDSFQLWGSAASGTRNGIQLKFAQEGSEHVITSHTSGGEFIIYPQRWSGRDRFRIRSHSSRTDYVDDLVVDSNGNTVINRNLHVKEVLTADSMILTYSNNPANTRYALRYESSNGALVISSSDSNGDWWKRMEFDGRGIGRSITLYNHLNMNERSIHDLGNLDVYGTSDFYGQTEFHDDVWVGGNRLYANYIGSFGYAGATSVYLGVQNEARVTNRDFYNDGDTTYMPIRASSFPTASLAEYKDNIEVWEVDILDIYRNDITIYDYNLRNQVRRRQGLVIGEGYNTPGGLIDGEGTEQYLMNSWNMKAIQELIAYVDRLEERIHELEKGVA